MKETILRCDDCRHEIVNNRKYYEVTFNERTHSTVPIKYGGLVISDGIQFRPPMIEKDLCEKCVGKYK